MGIQDIINLVSKNVKGVHTSIMSESDIARSSDTVKTISLDLNRILSGNLFQGIPNRSLVGIVGPEGTMKSSFMILCMVEAIKQGYQPYIIDTERGASDQFCSRWGLDLSKVGYSYTPWIDRIMSILAQIKDSGEKKLIIGLDSVGGIDKYKMYSDALDGEPKADQGQLQRQIRSMLKLLLNICVEQESIGIVTGHMYGSPGSGSGIPMEQVGGGKAMRLFPTILLQLKREAIKMDGVKGVPAKIIGSQVKATTIKNRMYPPFQEALISIDYVDGINPYAGILDLAVKAGLVEKAGSWFSYKGNNIGQGEIKAMDAFGDHPEILEDINTWLEKTKYSNINTNVKEAEELFKTEVSTNDETEEHSENEEKPKRSRKAK